MAMCQSTPLCSAVGFKSSSVAALLNVLPLKEYAVPADRNCGRSFLSHSTAIGGVWADTVLQVAVKESIAATISAFVFLLLVFMVNGVLKFGTEKDGAEVRN